MEAQHMIARTTARTLTRTLPCCLVLTSPPRSLILLERHTEGLSVRRPPL